MKGLEDFIIQPLRKDPLLGPFIGSPAEAGQPGRSPGTMASLQGGGNSETKPVLQWDLEELSER